MAAFFPLAPGEELNSCPYDGTHHILTSKLEIHLKKCRENYLKMYPAMQHAIRKCPFNATHHIPARDFVAHEASCPDRPRNDVVVGAARPPPQVVVAPPSVPAANNEEDWEAESGGGYDPSLKLRSQLVMHTPHGMTKSQLKKFRKQVQQAHQRREQGEDVDYPDTTGLETEEERVRRLRRRDRDDDEPRPGPSRGIRF